MQSREDNGARKRKSHKKSRKGCRNCKLRGVKCDETSPKCKKCESFGVSCNYDSKAHDLHASFDQVVSLDLEKPQKESRPPDGQASRALTMMGTPAFPYPVISDVLSCFRLDHQTMARLERFRTRTVLTIATAKTRKLYQQEIVNLCFAHPYLMHVVQTLTAMHDRFLTESPRSRPSVPEIDHWTQAVSLFNRKLSAPIAPADRDSLWATAALLGSIAFSSIDATTPEEAWPLKPSDASDLHWLTLSEGKKTIWIIADPLRPDSVFHSLSKEFENSFYSKDITTSGIDGIPPAFVELYNFDVTTTAENNPYYVAVHMINGLLDVECVQANIVQFFSFSNRVKPHFLSLVAQKDPRALLLVAYWYAKIRNAVWWVHRRATLEGQAICIYLERWYSHDIALHDLLLFSKRAFGLVS